MSQYFEGIISKFQCGFRKVHSTQNALTSLLEKWRNNIEQGLMSVWRPFKDCLPHGIIITKLYAYGSNMKGLGFTYDYLKNHKQRKKKIMQIAPGKTYYMKFLKGRFWGLYYLI